MIDRPELAGVPAGMSAEDAELLASALALLDEVYVSGRHEVASMMRAADGSTFRGVHVEASSGRASVCAEGAALAAAIAAGHERVEAIVSVLRRPSGTEHIIEPCGVCAELLGDYAPDARVWVAEGDSFAAIRVAELLPARRARSGRDTPSTGGPVT